MVGLVRTAWLIVKFFCDMGREIVRPMDEEWIREIS